MNEKIYTVPGEFWVANTFNSSEGTKAYGTYRSEFSGFPQYFDHYPSQREQTGRFQKKRQVCAQHTACQQRPHVVHQCVIAGKNPRRHTSGQGLEDLAGHNASAPMASLRSQRAGTRRVIQITMPSATVRTASAGKNEDRLINATAMAGV